MVDENMIVAAIPFVNCHGLFSTAWSRLPHPLSPAPGEKNRPCANKCEILRPTGTRKESPVQTSRQVVENAIEFRGPDRLPLIFPSLGMSDIHDIPWNQAGTGDHLKSKTYDEWGCGWERTEKKNMGQITEHPLLQWRSLASYRWPDPDDSRFYEGMEERFDGSEGKYPLTYIFMLLFERMHGLHGFQNTLEDLYLETERISDLADRIVEFDIRLVENISARFPGLIRGISFTDDWGTELALFIGPEKWKEFFMPRYARIFKACKAAGWHVWMHSCGRVNDIIEPLIGIGLDVINLQQPRALGIEEIGRSFAGRICFSSLCDIQHTLPGKGAEEIQREAELLLRAWGTPDGGFILSDYGDGEAIGVAIEKKRIMLDAFTECDRWRA